MKTYNCIIIEDEPLALERTKSFVLRIPNLKLLNTFDNALEGMAFINSQPIDILFLDIRMDELSGIELLENSKIKSQVIFTTAYQEYAIKGYELNVTDYLLKPFTFNRFVQAVNKAQENLMNYSSVKEDTKSYFFVKTENRLEKVMFDEILFIKGMRDYRRIFTEIKSIMTLQTFIDLEQIIPREKVCRVHKSYMVAPHKINTIERNKIIIKDNTIPISATYRKAFYTLIENQVS